MSQEPNPETNDEKEEFIPISTLMMFADMTVDFSVYVRIGEKYILYAREKESFTERHKRKLNENGVSTVYIAASQRDKFNAYMEQNLGRILGDPSVSIEQRSRIFYDASGAMAREILEDRLPRSLSAKMFERVMKLAEAAIRFMGQEGSLRAVASLISHDYQTWSHSVHTLVYTTAILSTYDFEEKAKVEVGVGALLHDIGKTHLSRDILLKPGPLTSAEWEEMKSHPARGVGMCSCIPLPQPAVSCILFHHERYAGGGYPSGIGGDLIPLPVRILSLADAYDALTSDRPYAKAVTPFEALRIMQNEMRGAYDMDCYRRMVMVLSDANVI